MKSLNDKLDSFDANSRLGKDFLTKSDVDCLQEQLKALFFSEKQCGKVQSILRSLKFDTHPVRHEQIAAAHERTFRWALKADSYEGNGSNIGEWLEHGDGVFWIS